MAGVAWPKTRGRVSISLAIQYIGLTNGMCRYVRINAQNRNGRFWPVADASDTQLSANCEQSRTSLAGRTGEACRLFSGLELFLWLMDCRERGHESLS